MDRMFISAVCILAILALTVPAFADGASGTGGSVKKFTSNVYKRGSNIAQETEGHISGCLRHAFGLFNPCLDLVKSCTGMVLWPVEKSVGYVTKAATRPAKVQKKDIQEIPVPKKPDMPK